MAKFQLLINLHRKYMGMNSLYHSCNSPASLKFFQNKTVRIPPAGVDLRKKDSKPDFQ